MVCVQVVARCKEDILKSKGVKPTLSPNLNTLATVEALDVKKLLFIGVGCQVLPCHVIDLLFEGSTQICLHGHHNETQAIKPCHSQGQ